MPQRDTSNRGQRGRRGGRGGRGGGNLITRDPDPVEIETLASESIPHETVPFSDHDHGTVTPHDTIAEQDTGTQQDTVDHQGTVPTASRSITPRGPAFRKLVLHPRGIFVNAKKTRSHTAYAYFGTEEPLDGSEVDYHSLDGLSDVDVWVSMDKPTLQSTATEYREMKLLNLCEEEFATFAKETFFLRTPRSTTALKDRCWRVDRMLQLVSAPDEDAHWNIPPLVDCNYGKGVNWSWDLRPDCSYWLSLKSFNPEYRDQIEECTFVKGSITCPYLTIEFKRTNVPADVAITQALSAGALALYNRYCLRKEALELLNTSWGIKEISDIRHYAITFVGSAFIVWVLEPSDGDGNVRGSNRWSGCQMRRLKGGDCTEENGVRGLVRWTNEIHRWALSRHAPACSRDIKILLRGSGVRTSDAQPAREDK